MSSSQKSPRSLNSPGSAYSPNKQASPSNPQWNDLWAAVLFYVHLALLAVITIAVFLQEGSLPADKVEHGISRETIFFVGVQALALLVTSGFLTAISMRMFRQRTEWMIRTSIIAEIVLLVLLGATILILNPDARGIVICSFLLLFAGILAYAYYSWGSVIPFSVMIIKTVLDCVETYPSVYWILAGSLGISLLFTILISWTFYLLKILYFNDSSRSYAWAFFFCLFSFLWTAQVIGNVFQTTIAGVFATHYFLPRGQRADDAASGALRRALTYSFGSICLGSLIVALIQFLRIILKAARGEKNSISGEIVACLLRAIEDLVRYFNYYAYTQIAIYGKSFLQASVDTWELLKRHGISAIINDNITGILTGMLAFAIGVCCGMVSFMLSWLVYSMPMNIAYLLSLSATALGCVIPSLVFKVIGAGSTALFVCISEDPAALRRNDPQFYELIESKYEQFAAV